MRLFVSCRVDVIRKKPKIIDENRSCWKSYKIVPHLLVIDFQYQSVQLASIVIGWYRLSSIEQAGIYHYNVNNKWYLFVSTLKPYVSSEICYWNEKKKNETGHEIKVNTHATDPEKFLPQDTLRFIIHSPWT